MKCLYRNGKGHVCLIVCRSAREIGVEAVVDQSCSQGSNPNHVKKVGMFLSYFYGISNSNTLA
jgi:hypothetical protein